MGSNQTKVRQLESIQGGKLNHKRLNLIQPKKFEFQGEGLQATPPHSNSCVDTSSMKMNQN